MTASRRRYPKLCVISYHTPVMILILFYIVLGVNVCEGQDDCNKGGLRGVAAKIDGWNANPPFKISLTFKNDENRKEERTFSRVKIDGTFYWRYPNFLKEEKYWETSWELTINEYGYEEQTMKGYADRLKEGGPCWAVYEFELKPTIWNVELKPEIGIYSFCFTKSWRHSDVDQCEERKPQRSDTKWRKIEGIKKDEAARILVFDESGGAFLVKKDIYPPDQNLTTICDRDEIARSIFRDRKEILMGHRVKRPACIGCMDEDNKNKVDPYLNLFRAEPPSDSDVGMSSIIVNSKNPRRTESFINRLKESEDNILKKIKEELESSGIDKISFEQKLGPLT